MCRAAATAQGQRGAALLLSVLAVFTLAFAALALMAAAPDGDNRPAGSDRFDQARRGEALLAQTREQVLDWYAGQLAILDAPGGDGPSQAQVFAAIGAGGAGGASGAAAGNGGLRFAAGPLRGDAALSFRAMVLWITVGADDATGFDAQGIARPDPRVQRLALFSSEPLQREARARTEQQLRTLAQWAERRFDARLERDATHDVSVNHFRDADGACQLDTDQLPCTDALAADGWAPMSTLAARTLAFGRHPGAGLAERNAWGLPIFASNDAEPSLRRPPYRMAFRTATPWGGVLTVQAVQPQ